MRQFGSYRTRDLVLAYMSALAAGDTETVVDLKWISELDWARWDSQVEADAEAGRLDFLIAEAREARERGALEEL